jgi:hypothetical protein
LDINLSRSPDLSFFLLTLPSHPPAGGQWLILGFHQLLQLRGSGGFSPRFPSPKFLIQLIMVWNIGVKI